jgi:hypothetical protein
MPIATAYSTKDLAAAVAELKQQCGNPEPRMVLCFASTKYDPAGLSRELKATFPEAVIAGCSTAGEIVSGRMLTDSVVAMFLDGDSIEDAACAVVKGIRQGAGVAGAFGELEAHFGTPVSAMDIEKYVGVVLFDGMSGAEERLMEQIGDRTDLFFIGGSAGDDLKFKTTHIMANGEAYSDAALLVLLKVRKGFDIIKTQSFTTTDKTLVATEVDEANRKVIRFNGKPAVEAYAEAVGVTPEKAAAEFMRHPLGLMVEGEPYVRSPQRVEGSALIFYCRITEGAELQVLNGTDIVADTCAAVSAKKAELGKIAGIVDFHCILRTLQLRAEKRSPAYGAIFADLPAIGFSTYGEAYLGHINQTSTMLVFR